MHYGLFKGADDSLVAAQQCYSELVLSQLPAPPARILEVGVGLGATLSLLMDKGYQVHGITPDAKQVAYIQHRFDTKIPVSCQALEDFQASPASYDVMLLQESGRYIDPLVIFNKALDFLSPSGSLLIIDEFALKRSALGVEGLHLRADILSLAARFGFDTAADMDLSELVVPTLDYRLRVTGIHRQQLINDLALESVCLTKLDESNRMCQEKYATGSLGYGLLRFCKGPAPKWRLSSLERKNLPDFFDLFNSVFGSPMTPELWQWKYGLTDGRQLCAWQGEKLVAHYGGMPRKIMLFGKPQTAVQIGDVMVSSNHRGVLTRSGPFFRLAATFLEQYIGYGKPYLLGFGFPNDRAMAIAEKLKLYSEVGHLVEISWAPSTIRPCVFTRLHLLSEADAPEVDGLWHKMRSDLTDSIVGTRDWNYLRQRYLLHPHQHYYLLIVKNRIGGKARGVIVCRHDPEGCEMVDVIAPLHDLPLLITQARRHAKIAKCARFFCRITENFSSLFTGSGGVKQDVGIRIPANAWSDGPPPESLKNRWWLMTGDMDFR